MPLRKIHLLVVEDSPSFQYLIHEAFSTRGEIRWELMIAKDGAEALRLLFEEENEDVPLPDLIFLIGISPKYQGAKCFSASSSTIS
jgi:CheY-like chemotaxis protein